MSGARLDNRKEIELAEGISVHLYPAGLITRALARLIDTFIIAFGVGILKLLIGLLGLAIGFEMSTGMIMLLSFATTWFYDPLFELMKTPATPGKRMMKLRVVKLSGSPTTFDTTFLRALLLPLDFFPAGLTGMISILSSKNSQRLGDLVAGTIVVHHMDDIHEAIAPISVPLVRPPILLNREEQIAFVDFGRRHHLFSMERQEEISSCFNDLKGSSKDARQYALGISNHFTQNEQ